MVPEPSAVSWATGCCTLLRLKMLFSLLLVLTRSTQRAAARAAPAGPVRPVTAALRPDVLPADRLAQEIAALDALFAQQQAPSDDVRRAYEQRRGELRDALAAALAGSGVGR